MSIAVLKQVYDETKRLAVAGSAVAPGDFRLKKLIEPLEKSGKKAPVFAKVAQSVKEVVEADEKKASAALLDLSTLVNAILYTQGSTEVKGELEPLETIGQGLLPQPLRGSFLSEAHTALSSSGSGRMEVVEEANRLGAFRDLRLLGPAIEALEDTYHEMVALIEQKILPQYGAAIAPVLRESLSLKGGIAEARKFTLICQADHEAATALIDDALENGSKEVRVAAIGQLRDPSYVPFLIEQTTAKTNDARDAAFRSLAHIDTPEAAQAISEALQKMRNLQVLNCAPHAVQASVLKTIIGLIHDQIEEVAAVTAKSDQAEAKCRRLYALLGALGNRSDEATQQILLTAFEQRDAIRTATPKHFAYSPGIRLVQLLGSCSPETRRVLLEHSAELPSSELHLVVEVACDQLSPEAFFDQFHPYLKLRKQSLTKMEIKAKLDHVITTVVRRHHQTTDSPLLSDVPFDENLPQLDSRWLDTAVKYDVRPLVLALARPEHAGAMKVLDKEIKEQVKRGKADQYLTPLLDAVILTQHPRAGELFAKVITMAVKREIWYFNSVMTHRIPMLPKQAAELLEPLVSEIGRAHV